MVASQCIVPLRSGNGNQLAAPPEAYGWVVPQPRPLRYPPKNWGDREIGMASFYKFLSHCLSQHRVGTLISYYCQLS